jgi:hypothetical protein
MSIITEWWQALPWSKVALVAWIIVMVVCIAFLVYDTYTNRRRVLRIKAKELDPAITTGQFYIPTQFKDKKDVNTYAPRR